MALGVISNEANSDMDSIESVSSTIELRTRDYLGRGSGPFDELGKKSPSISYREQFRSSIVPVERELFQFEREFARALQHDDLKVAEMLAYVADLGGKRLRPSLLLLAAKCFGPATDESIRMAVVLELVHTATLIHDDVLDQAVMRRHKPTLHQRWTVDDSILIGDWLFAQAYRIANEGDSTIPGRWVAEAAKKVCTGEILQGKATHDYRLSVRDYTRMIEGKTGELCAASCALGGWSVGASPEHCESLRLFGLNLGVAFQIIDDWIDLWGQESSAGKTTGRDLESFKPTLPALYTLEQMDSERRELFVQKLLEGDLHYANELRLEMDRCDASNFTKEFASQWVGLALEHLRELIPSNGRNGLILIAQSVVQRTV